MKTSSLTIINTTFILLIGLVVGAYLLRPVSIVRTEAPVFTSEAVQVQPVAKAQAVPAPQPTIAVPMPIMPPKVVFSVLPKYPESAISQGLSGTTLLSVQVGISGKPERVEVKSSSGAAELDQAAVEAVRQWVFSPAVQAGAALASCYELPVRFEVK